MRKSIPGHVIDVSSRILNETLPIQVKLDDDWRHQSSVVISHQARFSISAIRQIPMEFLLNCLPTIEANNWFLRSIGGRSNLLQTRPISLPFHCCCFSKFSYLLCLRFEIWDFPWFALGCNGASAIASTNKTSSPIVDWFARLRKDMERLAPIKYRLAN